ncbi:piggyBac transposable element-derived protein 4-like [Schistocerca piceifrons]|uniref:piggyBac transposable element-derived protein 4-like n=1 Tax=Schistocerca piceifrons TaxID=274613 RepID=UPI001F5EC081|nr:piggyBac transposable element-derived protein 4-like [Schistocerca piceifrons]
MAKKKGEPGFDALYKVRPLLNSLRERFQNIYYPEKTVTVNEGICHYSVRVGFKVYMANKPNKYGMKLYILAESRTGYIWNFEVYHGRDETIDNSASSVMKRLANKFLGKGHIVYVDRFYTSVQLAEELTDDNTGLVGTMMKNRKGLPKLLKDAKLKKGEQMFRHKGNVLPLRWKGKRDFWMISTRHTVTMQSARTGRAMEKLKRAAVVDYNKNKAGVDLFDQRLLYWALDHKTVKWWRKLAVHCIIMAASKGCILHNIIKKKKLATSQFIQEVCAALVLSAGDSTESFPHGSSKLARLSEKHFPNHVNISEGKKKGQRSSNQN